MPWAATRQLMYAGIVLAVLVVIGIGSWFLFFYHAPTCSDGIQNQNEEGIDCGGLCSILCQAPRVSALWARAVEVAPGVYHAVAMVKNPEVSSGTGALPYTFRFYDANNVLIASREGVMSLSPDETVPLFEANIVTKNRVPIRTFVDFGAAVWQRMDKSVNPLTVTPEPPDSDTLRQVVHVQNTTARPVGKVTLTTLLFNAQDQLIAASQTNLPGVAARETRDAVFTWQVPFSESVTRFEVTSRLQ